MDLTGHRRQCPHEEIIDLTKTMHWSYDYYRRRFKPPCRLVWPETGVDHEAQYRSIYDKPNEKVKDAVKKTIIKKEKDKTPAITLYKIPAKPKEKVCSICWDKLGTKPLGSTMCGHVFCFVCLDKSARMDRRCPTCRGVLFGDNSYHPLYLDLD